MCPRVVFHFVTFWYFLELSSFLSPFGELDAFCTSTNCLLCLLCGSGFMHQITRTWSNSQHLNHPYEAKQQHKVTQFRLINLMNHCSSRSPVWGFKMLQDSRCFFFKYVSRSSLFLGWETETVCLFSTEWYTSTTSGEPGEESIRRATVETILLWNIIMEVWFRSCSFLNGWFVGEPC